MTNRNDEQNARGGPYRVSATPESNEVARFVDARRRTGATHEAVDGVAEAMNHTGICVSAIGDAAEKIGDTLRADRREGRSRVVREGPAFSILRAQGGALAMSGPLRRAMDLGQACVEELSAPRERRTFLRVTPVDVPNLGDDLREVDLRPAPPSSGRVHEYRAPISGIYKEPVETLDQARRLVRELLHAHKNGHGEGRARAGSCFCSSCRGWRFVLRQAEPGSLR